MAGSQQLSVLDSDELADKPFDIDITKHYHTTALALGQPRFYAALEQPDRLDPWVADLAAGLPGALSGTHTHSPAQAGILTALRLLPYLLLGLPAGALIDRWDRKRVMLICGALRALAMGSIPLAFALGQLSTAQLYLVTILEGALMLVLWPG